MKRIIFFGLLLLFSCNQDEKVTGKETELVFQSEFNTLDLFAIDRDNRIVRHEHFTQEDLHDNTLQANLPLGRYRVACVANCPDIDFNTGETLENILLRLPRKGDTFQEANDTRTALQSVSISENKDATFVIRLARRVARLQVTLNDIPEDVDHLNFELSFVPSAINFTGTNTNTFGTITKPFNREADQASVELLTFPAKKGEATLSVTYRTGDKEKRKIIPFSESVDTNQIIRIEKNFPELEEGGLQGNGINLLQNGDFEIWNDLSKEPDGWRFFKDGRDSSAVKVNEDKVHSGKQAVFLQGKTYLYQDVEVKALQRYEIKMFVNAASSNFSWKYYCYWRKSKSTALPAKDNEPIQAHSYQKQTDGWFNVFNGKTFTAPEGAKLLRVEIRTYGKEILPGEGIYIDDFSVELVE
ncbi:FimB/Mfa2 family fimbrial subunit [Butyricimonas synergistica]|mgnify:CR=1 FL=1|uniref:FimB/Mfa2 family fimbrial subunit n=1 Tax=Butyricimonas synergistica TaxID=544644 RepID=UPI000375A324|nr:FimB/Mfa2 family fimbrial subunit [Butyricimonas synergistica]